MIPLSKYAKVYNKYCVYYFGPSIDVINSLINQQQIYKDKFPDIEVFICCNDELFATFEKNEKVISKSSFIKSKNEFGYIREIKPNFNNPI